MKPLHLLILPSFYPTLETPLDGIFFKEQALMLKERGIKIGVIYPEIRPLKQFCPRLGLENRFQISYRLEQGLPTCRLHGWNLSPACLRGTMHVWCYAASRLFNHYVQQQGSPDLIHAHSSIWAGIAAARISEKTQIPFLLTEHRDQFLHATQLSKKWLRQKIGKTFAASSKNLAVSSSLQKSLLSFLSPSPTQVTLLPNFIDQDFFISHTERPSLPFTFLTVAHLVKSKNIQCLLHAFQLLLQKDSQVKLQIVGDGPEKKYLQRLAEQLQITAHLEFLGEQPRLTLKEIYAKAHAFALPSLYETFGVVFIEALAMGLPVIGTRCGGPEDIITPEVGMLLEKNDAQQLAQAMLQIKENYAAYNPKKLRAYAATNFGKQIITDKLIEIYSNSS